ncbi:MAG: hypothetical protein LBT02_03180 [Rickettsiales bacterium]|nr:hypothetical protein [Rickettsiales bacterium]
MAGIRLVKAVQEKNSEDPKERADAVVTMKGAIITIVLAGLIGLVGFNVFVTFVGV